MGSRFCGVADQTFPRLRGALPAGIAIYSAVSSMIVFSIQYNFCADKPTRKALDELSTLFSYLRTWKIEKNVYINALLPPSERYHRDIFFQVL